MIAHARACAPLECCGLLAADGDGALVMAYCLENADASPVAYTVAPADHFGALRHAERMGWELAGAFHSHPRSAAYPSPTDVARAPEPDWLYVVIGLVDAERPEVKGFWIRDGEVVEEPLDG